MSVSKESPLGRGRAGGVAPVAGAPVAGAPVAGAGADVARARTSFLVEDPVPSGVVREPILASWTRSRLWRVHPEHLDLPFEAGSDLDSVLTRAAEPVLR
ncbi:MAG: modulated sigma54 specific transcriptional regulator, Fis family, partial [Blastococcus sp.]|nr:modulated sigma54 specific transcriptional regulator, Fis family [Blastococcus sp.]